jgi:tRNA threonylcarbamoyladenosine biosynthesis protein TsaB
VIVLAFDTCLGAVSAALLSAEPAGMRLLAHAYEERQTGHAERLFPMIEAALSEAGLAFADVRRVAVTLGPGTFTGVRTGVAAARGLVLASGCEVVGVTSLEAIARGAAVREAATQASVPLVVAVDARRGQAYVQRFQAGDRAPVGPPELLGYDDVAAALPAGGVVAVGSGAASLAQIAGARGIAVTIAAGRIEPDARDVAELGVVLAPLTVLKPLYIRPPDAKPPVTRDLRA